MEINCRQLFFSPAESVMWCGAKCMLNSLRVLEMLVQAQAMTDWSCNVVSPVTSSLSLL